MKLPLIYAQIKVDNVDPGRERPFKKDHQDFQHNMKNLENGSATTNGGWTVRNTISRASMRNNAAGGRTSSSGE